MKIASYEVNWSIDKADKSRAITKCDLIAMPALWQKLAFCRQTDIWTETWKNGQTG